MEKIKGCDNLLSKESLLELDQLANKYAKAKGRKYIALEDFDRRNNEYDYMIGYNTAKGFKVVERVNLKDLEELEELNQRSYNQSYLLSSIIIK